MTSITSWTRIEPRAWTGDKAVAAEARLFDPLWSLARQWQLGEFQAEDTGTPIIARIRGTQAALDRKILGPRDAGPAGSAYDPLTFPLEVAVERRPVRASQAAGPTMLRWAAEAGAHFLAMLDAQPLSSSYRTPFTRMFAFEHGDALADGEGDAFLEALAGRALDGRRLARAIRSGSASSIAGHADLAIAAGDRAEVRQAILDWLKWYDGFFSEPDNADAGAWMGSRLEYAVSVSANLSDSATDEIVLTAAEYADGHLGWSDFDISPGATIPGSASRTATTFVSTSIPAPVTIPGTPATRFWEIEDTAVANNLISTGPSDIGQLLMIEYGSVYGNDWFVVPLDVPVGSLTRIDSLVVIDTFGVKSLMQPVGSQNPRPDWAMWQLDMVRQVGVAPPALPAANLLFMPSALGTVLDGPSLEQVHFLRDEMANMAWAIEHSLEGPLERALPGLSAGSGMELAVPEPADADALPLYRLSSAVPDNWIPLLPVERTNAHGKISSRLIRGAMLQPDGSQIVHSARGQLLGADGTRELFDEEVPREGIRVNRWNRITRWTDGSTILWRAYRKQVGRGEGSSGLRFDGIGDNTAD
jgi:hypothetical protein